jgi:ATP-dependent helicase HepA
MNVYKPGQRYYSSAEPELGLGTVLRVEGRAVQVVFTKSGMVRQYAQQSAPLARVEFRVGDQLSAQGKRITVESIELKDGLQYFASTVGQVCETELDDEQAAGSADLKLINGRVDSNKHFQLRVDLLKARARARSSPAYGVHGARVGLLRHQLRVVEQVLKQPQPRVLLADEVGLGKTIEAGLILSRLMASGRVQRALIVTPEALVVQWFVELMRRFNLRPAIFDEERAASIEASNADTNPFQDDQLVLTDINFLSGSEKRARQVVDAGWDLLIVDEAHHLAWSEEEASAQYQLVESLSLKTGSVLLLTATPEQLGLSGHFARLRLLDPDRYSSFKHFEAEVAGFVPLSHLAERLLGDEPLEPATLSLLRKKLADEDELLAALDGQLGRLERDKLIDALVDRHGTGRVMMRNRRVSVGGFPKRRAQLVELADPKDAELRTRLLEEFKQDVGLSSTVATSAFDAEREALEVQALSRDPRFEWLLALLEQLGDAKAVLICRTARKVHLLESALRVRSGVKLARFHEGLQLAQRDRNAAYFQDPEGARLLLCSEIGSEGRNFQFAHHLVLWDLPLDPDLTEQRIGRLDRIGQTAEIQIHHAAVHGSAQRVVQQWYHRGMGAFESSVPDGRALLREFAEPLVTLALKSAENEADESQIEALIKRTATLHGQLADRVHQGRDRLLEVAAERSRAGVELIHALEKSDADVLDDELIVRLMENFGVDTEELAPRTFRFDPEYVSDPAFTGLGESPQTITFDRQLALSREELPLLRFDHPLVQGAVDLYLSGDAGTSAFLVDGDLPPQLALLECVFLAECVADVRLDVERYMPTLPLRVLVDSKLAVREGVVSERAGKRGDEIASNLAPLRKVLDQLVPPMLKVAEREAQSQAAKAAEGALEHAREEIRAEIERLEALRRVNSSVREVEIRVLGDRLSALEAAIPGTRVRLDAIRLVAPPPFMKLR